MISEMLDVLDNGWVELENLYRPELLATHSFDPHKIWIRLSLSGKPFICAFTMQIDWNSILVIPWRIGVGRSVLFARVEMQGRSTTQPTIAQLLASERNDGRQTIDPGDIESRDMRSAG